MTDIDETEWQMLTKVGKKFAALFFFILMIDDLFDWLTELLYFAFELSYVILELTEYLFEMALANLLHTDHRQNEIIFVYVATAIVLFASYRFYLAIPELYLRWKKNLQAFCIMRVKHETAYWQALSVYQKVKLTAAYTLGTGCLLFWLTI